MQVCRIFPTIILLVAALKLSASSADVCPTDGLRSMVGRYHGVASIVAYENGIFSMRRPRAFAPRSIASQSIFELDAVEPCHRFHVKIEYLNPEWVAALTGNRVVREVEFDGEVSALENLFVLSAGGVPRGDLRVIDRQTFLATFDAPNPLDPTQMLYCKEFISLTNDGKNIVRTIQCFDKLTGRFVQDRLTMETFD